MVKDERVKISGEKRRHPKEGNKATGGAPLQFEAL